MDEWKESLRKLNTQEQLLFVESYLPDAYEYLTDTANSNLKLPTFDDNDDLASWNNIPQDKEENNHA